MEHISTRKTKHVSSTQHDSPPLHNSHHSSYITCNYTKVPYKFIHLIRHQTYKSVKIITISAILFTILANHFSNSLHTITHTHQRSKLTVKTRERLWSCMHESEQKLGLVSTRRLGNSFKAALTSSCLHLLLRGALHEVRLSNLDQANGFCPSHAPHPIRLTIHTECTQPNSWQTV